MSESLTIQSTRIVTSQKLDDRFLTAQRYVPETDEQRILGELSVLVEITRPWFPLSQIGSSILATCKKTYYEGSSTSDLVNFELAIKAVNDMLQKITEQGDTEWIGHLNAVAMVVIGKEIHLSSTGNADAFLFRDGKVSYITSRTQDAEQNPVKTFKSVTSGSLLALDTIVLANPTLLDSVGLDILQHAVDDAPPYQASCEIRNQLKKSKQKTVNAIVVRLVPESLHSNDPDVVYLDQASDTFTARFKKWWTARGKPLAQRVAKQSGTHAKNFGKLTKDTLIPKATTSVKHASTKTASAMRNVWSKTHPLLTKHSSGLAHKLDSAITGIKDRRSHETDEANNDPAMSIIGKSIYTIHDYQFQQSKKGTSWIRRIMLTFQRLALTGLLSTRHIISTIRNPKKRPLVLVVAGIVLVILLIISITVRSRTKSAHVASATQTATLQLARKKVADAKTALSFNKKKEAQTLFGQALKDAESLAGTPAQKDAAPVVAESQKEYDTLTGATRIATLDPIVTVTQDSFVTVLGSKGYTLSPDGVVSEVGLTPHSTAQKVAQLPESDGVTAIAQTIDQKLLIGTKGQSLFEFNGADGSITKLQPADGEKFSPIRALALYGIGIYTLDNENDQIWKYIQSKNVIDAAQKYIPRKQLDISKAVDIAIDGSVYVLDSTGKVDKLSKGERQEFKLTSIPDPFATITKPIDITLDEDNPTFFITDAGEHRLLEFDKNGLFTHQYILPAEFTTMSHVFIQLKARRAFIVNGDKLYMIDL